MKIEKFLREVCVSPYYRRRPGEVLRFAYAKYLFSRFRLNDPAEFLQKLGIDRDVAFAGLQRWLPTLERVASKVRQRQGCQGGVSIEDGIILYGLTRAIKPHYVIETGVAAGVSTSFISAALIENASGILYSIELPPQESASRVHPDGAILACPQIGVGWAIPEEIKKTIGARHRLLLQDVRLALPALLKQVPHIDIFFHDDLHTPDHMLWEYDLVWPHLRSGGVLVSDDANFGWVRFCRKHGLSRRAFFNIQRLTAVCKQ